MALLALIKLFQENKKMNFNGILTTVGTDIVESDKQLLCAKLLSG